METEILNKYQNLQREMIKILFYESENIETFIHELNELKLDTTSDNCKDKEWISFVGKEIERLELIASLFYSKKLEKQKEDLKPLGRYIQELGKEIENYGTKN